MNIKIGALALVGLIAFPVAARADDVAPAGKATTPKACVEGIIDSAKKQDYDRMCSYMVEPYRTTMPKMLVAAKVTEDADDKLAKAMEAKWPGSSADLHLKKSKGPKSPLEGDVEILEVKEEGDSATVKTKETSKPEKEGDKPKVKEETIICKKDAGFWFAEPPQGKGGRQQPPAEQQAKMMDAMSGAMKVSAEETKVLADDIAGGKVASKEEAKMKHGAIQMKVMQAMMGASGGMGAPGGSKHPAGEKKPGEGGEKKPAEGDKKPAGDNGGEKKPAEDGMGGGK